MDQLRVLVALVNYGSSNDRFLPEILGHYRRMPGRVDVVAYCGEPKDLGPDIETRVGIPPEGPMYLAMEHRKLFMERQGRYDVYIYAEDDIPLTADHLRAFVEAAGACDAKTVPGFVRYELDDAGRVSVDSLHSYNSWKPHTVRSFGGHVWAELDHNHSAAYALDDRHLGQAIASGRFLEVASPRFIIEQANTGVFDHCGLRRLVPVSRLDEFLIHHMSNKYVGKLGVPKPEVDRQVELMRRIAAGEVAPRQLVPRAPAFSHRAWWKPVYEDAREDLIAGVRSDERSVLWVGAGQGRTEGAVVAAGHDVTAVPLDTLMAPLLEDVGVRVLSADLDEALDQLHDQTFDLVVLPEVLERFAEPAAVLRKLAARLNRDGRVFASVHNFARWPVKPELRAAAEQLQPRSARSFEHDRIHCADRPMVRGWLRDAGLEGEVTPVEPVGLRRYDLLTLKQMRPHLSPRFEVTAHPAAALSRQAA